MNIKKSLQRKIELHHLYAPWRSEYVKGKTKSNECIFCYIANSKDEEELGVIYKKKDYFIVMNKYPYSPGHFMIIPNAHIADLEELNSDIWLDMCKNAQNGVRLLKEILGASGVNMGVNIGKIAGAGIAEHLHLHLVPRWLGDTNFITTIGQTRVINTDFKKLYLRLKDSASKYF